MADGGTGQPQANDRADALAVWQQARPALARVVAALGWAGAADDILQDVYVTAIKGAAGKLKAAELRRWLFRVTINHCRTEHRRRQREFRARGRLAARLARLGGPQDAGHEIEKQRELELVRRALAGLEHDIRVPLVLRYFLEMDSGEIGRTLELNGSTVRSRLRTGRLALAAALRKAGYDHEQ
jgi:RNA polymerase sigma-70 factor (ECF subfamily)